MPTPVHRMAVPLTARRKAIAAFPILCVAEDAR